MVMRAAHTEVEMQAGTWPPRCASVR